MGKVCFILAELFCVLVFERGRVRVFKGGVLRWRGYCRGREGEGGRVESGEGYVLYIYWRRFGEGFAWGLGGRQEIGLALCGMLWWKIRAVLGYWAQK